MEHKGQYNFNSHLSMVTPVLKGETIHLTYPNQTIKEEVEREKGKLLNYLKAELKNDNIHLEIEVNEEAVKRYAYTTQEKYEKLKEKNPLIETLKKEFDLEI